MPAIEMGVGDQFVSSVLIDECFSAEDDRFVEQLRRASEPKYLAALADRWKVDPRPWARRQLVQYLDSPLDRPGHHPLVKRLFKQAEAARDHELMAAFSVAFDRLVRRRRRKQFRYDYQSRQTWQEEVLYAPHDQIWPKAARDESGVWNAIRKLLAGGERRRPGILFSYRTRHYLRRRAARYFRRLGFQRPQEYPQAVAAALALYRDDDFAAGENILDNWSLMQAAFRHSATLRFGRVSVGVVEGHSLGGLIAAPQFDKLWKAPESMEVLLSLLTSAASRLVRVWSMQLLNRNHASLLQTLSARQLLELLENADEEVQQFGADLLQSSEGADGWPVDDWLRILQSASPRVLVTICEAMQKRVRSERFDVEQCVTLACSRSAPVAQLGLAWLKGRAFDVEKDRATLVRLANAESEAVGAEIATFALSLLAKPSVYRVSDACRFFDSPNSQVRQGAWAWLAPGSQGYDDAELWSRLLETPFDDVRFHLIEALDARTRNARAIPALCRHDATLVWTTVLLGVHRGGRAKLRALRQISTAIAERPERAEPLLPVLAVALRSVRPPEARAGLAAVVAAVALRPELEAALARQLPELRLAPAGAAP